jgi:hypothetical protein
MSYNLTLLDRTGSHATVFPAPDRPVIVNDLSFARYHLEGVEDEAHAAFCNTMGRASHLRKLLGDARSSGVKLVSAFHEAPLFTTRYKEGFGTVYTALYEPTHGTVTLHWPNGIKLRHDLTSPVIQERRVSFSVEEPPGSRSDPSYDWLHPLPAELQALITRWWVLDLPEHQAFAGWAFDNSGAVQNEQGAARPPWVVPHRRCDRVGSRCRPMQT